MPMLQLFKRTAVQFYRYVLNGIKANTNRNKVKITDQYNTDDLQKIIIALLIAEAILLLFLLVLALIFFK